MKIVTEGPSWLRNFLHMMKFMLHESCSECSGLQAMKQLIEVVRFNPQQRIQSYTVERTVVVQTSQV